MQVAGGVFIILLRCVGNALRIFDMLQRYLLGLHPFSSKAVPVAFSRLFCTGLVSYLLIMHLPKCVILQIHTILLEYCHSRLLGDNNLGSKLHFYENEVVL